MHADKRQRLLDIAEQLFAERGFYGVSIAAIASEVGFTKQGVLHYFNSKEKLYGAILQRISDDFQKQQTEAEQAFEEPKERLKLFYAALAEPTDTNTRRTRLLMRELLDNNARAMSAENWYLKEFLERLIVMVKVIEGLQTLSDEEALIFAYQLLGAVNYFLISPATLSGIFGKDHLGNLVTRFSYELNVLIDSRVNQCSESAAAKKIS
jgi:AcrR family transcriptional regulator